MVGKSSRGFSFLILFLERPIQKGGRKPVKTDLIIVPVLVLLISFQLAWAKTLYKYQRDNGVEVTTDDFNNVPEKYRDSVEKISIMDADELERLMERNVRHGRPILWGFHFCTNQLEKIILFKRKEEVVKLLGEPESVSESGTSKIWRYDYDKFYWNLRDVSSKEKIRKVVLTLGFRSQDHYAVDDVTYSR
jgi:hypothetical protein